MEKKVLTTLALLIILYCPSCESKEATIQATATSTLIKTSMTQTPEIQSSENIPVETTETPASTQDPGMLGPIAHFAIGEEDFPFMSIFPIGEWQQDSSDESIEDIVKTASNNGFTVIESGFPFGESTAEQRLVFDKFVHYANIYNMRVIVSLFHGEDFETREMVEGDQDVIIKTKALIRESMAQVNAITGTPYKDDPTIMAWGFRDIGSLIMGGTEWRYDDADDFSLSGADVRDLLESLAQELKSNAPNQLVFASVSIFFTNRDDIYDYELEQPGWLTMQDAPSVDFWYWYVDSKPDYWGYRYSSPNDFLVGSTPFSKPFIAVLDPYMSHENQIESGLYTFDTLCRDDEWRASQLQKASQFFMDEVGASGLGIYQWGTDLQWDILMEIDRCFAITAKNPIVTQVFREVATKFGWSPTRAWDQDTFVTVVFDMDPASIPRRIWSESDYENRKTHIFTYRTIYEQLTYTALHDAETIIHNNADLELTKSRLNYWLQAWEEAYQRIPDDSYSASHLELHQAVKEILNGVTLIQAGDNKLGMQRIDEAVDKIEQICDEFEAILNYP